MIRLESQGLGWNDIQILQNWNNGEQMLEGCEVVYKTMVNYLQSPSDSLPDLTDLVLHDVASELETFREQNVTTNVHGLLTSLPELETCVLMTKIECDSEVFDMLIRGNQIIQTPEYLE